MKLVLALALFQGITSFQPLPTFRRNSLVVHSSTGDDGGQPPKPPDDGDNGPMGDFLGGFGKEESEGLKRAREYMSDESLPISFDSDDLDGQEEDSVIEEAFDPIEAVDEPDGGEIVYPTESMKTTAQDFFEEPSEELIRNNPYMNVVSSLTPSDLISKFTSTAHPRVQSAVRSTILGLIGSLPKMAFETTTITTGERLASVMFQLQMTGYLFKNAEYRLSLSQSLGSMADSPFMLPGVDDDEEDEDSVDPLKGKVKGKLKIKYSKRDESEEEGGDGASDSQAELEVDAAAYMSELRSEVSQLRDELSLRRKEKEEAIRKDLLMYIRTLPEQQLQSLTGTISQDVLIAMKGLVNVVMAGIGEGQIAADTVTEQSGEAMAQLCMWQLVVGYNLRELEVREEMKNSLGSFDSQQTEEGPDLSEPGAFD